jgi:dipeptidyl aminopeptidase/acylaminoacyl peptidase
MESVDINPAGTRLAWIEDDGKTARIVIHDIAANKALRSVAAPPKTKLWRVLWANDDTVLINQSMTRTIQGWRDQTDEWQRWVALDAAGGQDRLLLMKDAAREWVTGAAVERRRTTNAGRIFMSSWDWSAAKHKEAIGTRLAGGRQDSGWTYNVYEVDLTSGDGKLLVSGTPFTTAWLIDDAGKVIVRSEYHPKYDQFSILAKDGGGWRKLYEAKGCDRLGLAGFSADKTALLALGSTCADDKEKLWSLPLDGTPMTALVEHADFNVDGVYRDPLDGAVLGVSLGGGDEEVKWLDARAEKRIAALQRSFGGAAVSLVSRSADNSKVVVYAESGSTVPVYYLVDYTAKKADIINEAYPQLAGVKLGAVREFTYQARDQYPLMGYLTLPDGAPEKGLPLVVMPHGGPEARDEPGFDWLSQFLASRGYAVLRPQFRGSTGFGRAHADAGRRQWGLRMQDDVTDGVKALVAAGVADPKRVCIVGWSYGGYAALAGAAFTPDMYACAVSIAGISDLPEMLGWEAKSATDGKESNSFAYWRDHIGAATDPSVTARSPARFAGNFQAPVLLIHGVDDTSVPISQSRQMAQALKAMGKPVELVELAGEDHWMQTSSTSRIRTLTELERFLGKNLGAATPQTASN